MGVIHDHEQTNWPQLQQRLAFMGVSQETSARCYEEAVRWSHCLSSYYRAP